jgi:RNA 2',3'-cyclic 3'-phosphodiesterase
MPSPGLWRTFVAFPLCEASRAALSREAARLARLDDRLRIVPAANLHLTLAFLGPTSQGDVPRIAEALEEAARETEQMEVRVEGLGAFPRAESARVVWAGLVETRSAGCLATLVARCRLLLSAVGQSVDDRERFHAHVTLARLDTRSPSPPLTSSLKKALTGGNLQDTYRPEVLSDLHLMISESGPDHRTRYRPLATAFLQPVTAPPEPREPPEP